MADEMLKSNKAAMITRTAPICQTKCWQQILAEAIKDPLELLEILALDPHELPVNLQTHQNFQLRVPMPFVDRMRKGDPKDPLLLQVLPQLAEATYTPGFVEDPLQEKNTNPIPGLIHKYHGRVLLVLTGACAIHCRYCFRQHFPYNNNNPNKNQWQAILDYIAKDPSICEVILSGGDPLLLPDQRLQSIAESLANIKHLKRLRLHTRLPVVLPQRISTDCLAWLQGTRLQSLVVVHCNHPSEIDDNVSNAFQLIGQSGTTLLNQTVLLKGINDSASVLTSLSDKLFRNGVIPYYLHMLDKVQGASHFECSQTDANVIYHQLLKELPGYLVPRLVREDPGTDFKTPIYDPNLVHINQSIQADKHSLG